MQKCGTCDHEDEQHYGGDARWCNHPGCECKAFLGAGPETARAEAETEATAEPGTVNEPAEPPVDESPSPSFPKAPKAKAKPKKRGGPKGKKRK